MYKPRLTDEGIRTSIYYNRPYSTGDMSNCTTYAMFRICELLKKQCTNYQGYPIIDNHCFDRFGYGNACDWFKDWVWKKGQIPRLGAVACWSGTYKTTGKACCGHVAVVEQIYEDGSFLTSNSNYGGTFFYTQKIAANKNLPSSKYNFKFEGFCYIPLKEVEKDDSKYQVEIKVESLRIRQSPTTNAPILGVCQNGQLFNVFSAENDGTYRWLQVDDGWIATKPEWVNEYPPKAIQETYDDTLEKQIDILSAEIRELKKVNATLKDMLDSAQKALMISNDKLEKIGGVLSE